MNACNRTLWLFGRSAAGKTTIAEAIKEAMPQFVILDGDRVRILLNHWDFSEKARQSHLRYMAVTARMLNESNIPVLATFITPTQRSREQIKAIIPWVKFVWVNCTLEVLRRRDTKGLYAKKPNGLLDFEVPIVDFNYRLDTHKQKLDESVASLLRYIEETT